MNKTNKSFLGIVMKNYFSRYTLFIPFVGSALLSLTSTSLFAQSTFKNNNPSWSHLSADVTRTRTPSQAAVLADKVEGGIVDTRGTRVNVNNGTIERTGTGRRAVMPDNLLRLHTPLGTSFKLSPSSRWYQKDGNTQVFRVFPGDQNKVGGRVGAARSEAFSYNTTTIEADGKTLTFSARFHVAKHNTSRDVKLFQSKARGKNSYTGKDPAWSLAMWAEKDGDIILIKRGDNGDRNIKIDTGFNVGQSFNLRVVDDGYNYKAFVNNMMLADGSYERGDAPTVARWGAYVQGGSHGVLTGGVNDDVIVYVSGARVVVK